MPLSNAERQKRFRELTMKERQLKADAFDFLVTVLDSQLVQPDLIPLPDGRELLIDKRSGEAVVSIVANPRMQNDIEDARRRLLSEE